MYMYLINLQQYEVGLPNPLYRTFVCFTIFRVDNYLRHRTSLIWAGIIFEATVSIPKPYDNCLDQFSIRFLKIFLKCFLILHKGNCQFAF